MFYALGCIFLLLLLVMIFFQYKLAEASMGRYKRSEKLLLENPDDFVRRETFFKDAYSYYNALHMGAFSSPQSEVSSRLKLLNLMTQNRLDRYMRIGCSTKIGSAHYLSKSLTAKYHIDETKTKIFDVCSSKQSGASIIDIIVELREDRVEVLPVLGQLQREGTIVANSNASGILYKIH